MNSVAISMGARRGTNTAFENRLSEELQAIGSYLSMRKIEIFFAAGDNGQARVFLDAVQKLNGNIRNILPEYLNDMHLTRAFKNSAEQEKLLSCAFPPKESKEQYINSLLAMKRDMLNTPAAHLVFYGGFGTGAEELCKAEKTDTLARYETQNVTLGPLIFLNTSVSEHMRCFDSEIQKIELLHALGRLSDDRMNIMRFAKNPAEMIALFEAYENLGPVPANKLDAFVPVINGHPVKELAPDLSAPPYNLEY